MNKNISNIENYNKLLTNNVTDIFTNFTTLILEYSNFFIENTFIQNIQYFKYVYLKGIETMSIVFKLLLLYTNNLELTVYHCQKSFYYYIEFIGQIGDSNHQFLQLNSKDASLFVFKKTIFEIDSDFRKNFKSPLDQQLEKHLHIDLLINHMNILFKYKTECNDLKDKIERENTMKEDSYIIILLCNKIPNNNIHNSLDKVKLMNLLIGNLITKKVDPYKLISMIDILIKKVLKNNVNEQKVENCINSNLLVSQFEDLPINKFVLWLIAS